MWKRCGAWHKVKNPGDFVIATGISNSLQEFVAEAFRALNLDWREHTVLSEALRRPTDISEGRGNALKAERVLGVEGQNFRMNDVVSMMVDAELLLR